MPHDYVLARLLANNAQWAEEVSAADPDFFPSLAEKQEPKVSLFLARCKLDSLLLLVRSSRGGGRK